MNFSTFGPPFHTTLPPMHQFTKFSEPMLLNGGVQNAVMVTAVQADTLQYVPVSHQEPSSSPPRLTTLTSSVQVSPTKYAPMMWENMPILTTIDSKMVVPPTTQANAPVWRLVGSNGEILEYQEAHDLVKPMHIKEEEKHLEDSKMWSEAIHPDYPEMGHPQLGSMHVIMEQEQETAHMEQKQGQAFDEVPPNGKKKRTRKAKVKEKKPKYRPGEIRVSTALDGSTLFCCPECNMAYADRYELDQHMSTHKLERRFKCDECGATLKRKEHLDQHKRGHSTERPFVCSICMKGFKRNEHLTRHYVIHTGDKNFSCNECGKAFSRKDHLHKHAQTHMAKRVKTEMTLQTPPPHETELILSQC
ncbi:zinc finger protein with KRAB and SCAN domains 5-like [Neocloeon triangulifer]|uniref:zinc finger protein with KRAB and SCAN domains 5-like n=1 Tax=Neocloeon triangulifer TaxID=2078957 RepID=UPI00286F3F0E|nr:zinc finger protein with KRAB and SCAN domains 5-like [Neocloeon triangulifer]